jgi:hypothetical protein
MLHCIHDLQRRSLSEVPPHTLSEVSILFSSFASKGRTETVAPDCLKKGHIAHNDKSGACTALDWPDIGRAWWAVFFLGLGVHAGDRVEHAAERRVSACGKK